MLLKSAARLAAITLLMTLDFACRTTQAAQQTPETPPPSAATPCGKAATDQIVPSGACPSGAAIVSSRCDDNAEAVTEFVGCAGAPAAGSSPTSATSATTTQSATAGS